MIFLIALFSAILPAGTAIAIGTEPGERFHIRLVAPIENNSGFSVWESKYYPGDVLSEKMTDYVFRKMNEVHRVRASRLLMNIPDFWPTEEFSQSDMIVKINLEEFGHKKKDVIGSKVYWDVVLHAYVYNGATRRLLFDSVVEERADRQYIFYNDALDSEPIYWEKFEKTAYWPAIRKALDMALAEVFEGYNGYRVLGRIIAKAERVDGSLTVSKKTADKLYHINLGREDSVKEGDVLTVTRASSVRTVAPDTPEVHFPQVVGRVRVVFVKERDAIVAIIKESSEAPVELGDAVSMPLAGRRDGKGF
ncbi:MAG: hypothetical protein LBQ19_01535 [Synergistaceae bacterium]|nr:hypothetical protein [Synergistaceae bacterium]